MDKNYTKIKPLIAALTTYSNSSYRPWWGFGYIETRIPKHKDVNNVLRIVSLCDPSAIASFKYVVSLVYNCGYLRKIKSIREACLEYIDNFTAKNTFEKNDIAKYLNNYAPQFKRPWWALKLITVPALLPHEEAVLQKFRSKQKQHSIDTTTDPIITSLNLHSTKNLTDSKILKIAHDIDTLSKTIYTELPKIDQKIQMEIQRISDDLQGLAKLIDMLDNEVPFNVQSIKNEITCILDSFNKVIISSAESLKENINKSNQRAHHQYSANEQTLAELKKSVEIKAQNTLKSPTSQKYANYAELEKKYPISPSTNLKSRKDNYNQTQANLSYPTQIQSKKSSVKTIIADDIKWLDKSPVIKGPKQTRDHIQSPYKSYVNHELTEQLKASKNQNRTNEHHESLQQRGQSPWLSNRPNRGITTRAKFKSQEQINAQNQQNYDNFSETKNTDYSNPYSTKKPEQFSEQKFNKQESYLADHDDHVYQIIFHDPNHVLADTEVALDADHHVLTVDNESFDLDAEHALDELANYLSDHRSELQPINLIDIVTKFMYDTPLTMSDLEQAGLRPYCD